MKGNNVAKYMNIVNRNSVHKNIKRELINNNNFWINEELDTVDKSLLNDEDLSRLLIKNTLLHIELEE